MNRELQSIPITREHVLTIADTVRKNPDSPLVVPLSYEKVTAPGTLIECLDGTLQDPSILYLNDMNVPVGPSHLEADEHGRIYDARVTGITVESLRTVIKRDITTMLWTLQLNLADPSMPTILGKLRRAEPGLGLVAIVIPQLAQEYVNRLGEYNPLLYRP